MGIVNQIALQELADEIKNDPETLGYSEKSAAEIIDILTAPRSLEVPTYINTEKTPEEIIFTLIKRGKWEGIVEAALNDQSTGHEAAFKLYEVTKLQTIQLNWNAAAVRIVFNALKTASLLVEADITALTDEGRVEVTTTRAQTLSLPRLNLGIVEQAIILSQE